LAPLGSVEIFTAAGLYEEGQAIVELLVHADLGRNRMADSVSEPRGIRRIATDFAHCHADAMQSFSFYMAGLTDGQNLLENVEVMARPKRFELLTPRFVVWSLVSSY
jgi:hypothetical protein